MAAAGVVHPCHGHADSQLHLTECAAESPRGSAVAFWKGLLQFGSAGLCHLTRLGHIRLSSISLLEDIIGSWDFILAGA